MMKLRLPTVYFILMNGPLFLSVFDLKICRALLPLGPMLITGMSNSPSNVLRLMVTFMPHDLPKRVRRPLIAKPMGMTSGGVSSLMVVPLDEKDMNALQAL